MTQLVINKLDERRSVPIQKLAGPDSTGTPEQDSIFLQPRSRAKLPEGWEVQPAWLRVNASTVGVHTVSAAI